MQLLLLQAMREAWGHSAIGRVDMNYLSQIADPTVVMNAQRDPEVSHGTGHILWPHSSSFVLMDLELRGR